MSQEVLTYKREKRERKRRGNAFGKGLRVLGMRPSLAVQPMDTETIVESGQTSNTMRVIISLSIVLFLKKISASRCASKRTVDLAARSMSSKMPFGLGKMFGLGESDNLIATDRDRKLKKGDIPDFIPADLKKEMDEIGVDNIRDLDELEEANIDGYNDLGLVPPEGTGTFASPILVPSRRATRQVGYVDPESHALFWFTIHNDNNTYYIKDLGLFFKMLHIPDEEAFAHH